MRSTRKKIWLLQRARAIAEAASLLVKLIGVEAEIDLQPRRREVMQAANEWFTIRRGGLLKWPVRVSAEWWCGACSVVFVSSE